MNNESLDKILEELILVPYKIEEGETDAGIEYIKLKKIEKQLKITFDKIKAEAQGKLSEYTVSGDAPFGATVKGSQKLVISFLDDGTYKEIDKKLKDRKKMLTEAVKLKEKGGSLVDSETGEVIEAPGHTYSQVFSVTVK